MRPRNFAQEYWRATRDKKILLKYDKGAGKYQFFPRATSIYSGRCSELEWREASVNGEIFSYTIARRCREPFRGYEPFFIALVKLDEGVNVMANTVNIDATKMKTGLQVRPYWPPLSDGTHLLMFQPA